jgi:uncharacterized protein (DUF1778 family)
MVDRGDSCSASDTSADCRVIQLDAASWKAFTSALNAPPTSDPRLRKLLARKPAWER